MFGCSMLFVLRDLHQSGETSICFMTDINMMKHTTLIIHIKISTLVEFFISMIYIWTFDVVWVSWLTSVWSFNTSIIHTHINILIYFYLYDIDIYFRKSYSISDHLFPYELVMNSTCMHPCRITFHKGLILYYKVSLYREVLNLYSFWRA